MQNGLAYHFVIGNGTSTGNGQIEVGDRWRRQINGGHVHSDYLNNISLGICLVGDFNRDQPTRAQLEACENSFAICETAAAKQRGAIPVKPHREMNPPRWATDCPGDDFPYSWFRSLTALRHPERSAANPAKKLRWVWQGSLDCARDDRLLACRDDQIRFLVIPSVTESEIERRRVGCW